MVNQITFRKVVCIIKFASLSEQEFPVIDASMEIRSSSSHRFEIDQVYP